MMLCFQNGKICQYSIQEQCETLLLTLSNKIKQKNQPTETFINVIYILYLASYHH
jgi:hypothetical protein